MPSENAGDKWRKLRSDRRRIIAQLHKFRSGVVAGEAQGIAAGRTALLGAELVDGGGWVGTRGSREVTDRWPWDIDRERARIGGCESTVVVGWDGKGTPTDPGSFAPVAYRCGSRLCPTCFAARAGRQMHRWGPVLDAALADGADVWHVTLTQRCEAVWGSVVLPHEAGRWAGVVPIGPGVVHPAVAGESAGEAYDRWRSTWRTLRTSREGRTVAVDVGFLVGMEWTLRSKRGGRVARPRWHCHGHVLAVSPERWDPRPLMALWARLSDVPGRWTTGETRRGTTFLRYGAQYAERVRDRGGLLEVLKYPFKPGDMTCAAVLDAWSALRGSRTHQCAGALHGQSRAAAAEPWSRWLGAPREGDGWSLLERESQLTETVSDWVPVTHSDLGRMGAVRLRVVPTEGAPVVWETADVGPWAAVAAGHPSRSIDPVGID